MCAFFLPLVCQYRKGEGIAERRGQGSDLQTERNQFQGTSHVQEDKDKANLQFKVIR